MTRTSAYPDALPKDYRLHWYVIERVLGQGGFGITYLAHDTNLDQRVAIKEYLPVDMAARRDDAAVRARTADQAERYQGGLERFIREARTLARFDHPNIVRVLSVFEFNETAYMVMRFEEGETLAALLERRHALSEAELMRILLPILDGLELVHNAGFIHRDIKPDNIHIRSDGSPVLLDFGSARYAAGQARTVTILVAPGYAPFEQYYSTGENQGPWTDLYGLAATCYRAIAGRAPLDAISRSKGILGSTKEMLVPASVVGNSRYSERFLRAIDHALAFAEGERPQSIAEWRREIGDAPPAVAAATTRIRSTPPQELVAPPPAPPPPAAGAALRGPVIWGSVGALVVLAAASTLALLQRTPPAPVPMVVNPTAEETELRERIRKLEEKLQSEQLKGEQKREQETKLLEALRNEREKVEAERRRVQEQVTRRLEPPKRVEAPKPKREPPKPAADAPKEKTMQPAVAALAPAPAPKDEPVPQSALATPPAPPPPPKPAEAPKPRAPTQGELLAKADEAVTKGNFPEAVSILQGLAEKGVADAQVKLGRMHLEGQGIERNTEEALRLFQGAAGKGHAEANFRIGDMYAAGSGVKQSNYLAFVWYSLAARHGHGDAKRLQLRVGQRLQPAEIEQAGKLVESLLRKQKGG